MRFSLVRRSFVARAMAPLLVSAAVAGNLPAQERQPESASGKAEEKARATEASGAVSPSPPPGEQPPDPAGQAAGAITLPSRRYEIEVALTLEEAVRLGLANNLDIRVARVDDDIRRRELVIARSVFDPFFNLGANYVKNRDPSVSFFDVGSGGAAQGVRVNPSEILSYHGGLNGTWLAGTQYDFRFTQAEVDRPVASAAGFTFLNPVTSTEATVTARQPLLRGGWFGVNSADIRIAQNNMLLSSEQLELTATTTVFQIEQAYWELVFAGQNLEAKRKASEVTLENLEKVRKERAVGTRAAIDVTTAESQAALRRVELVEAEELRETSRDQLLKLINYSKELSLKERWETGSRVGPFDNIMVNCTTTPSLEKLETNRDVALGSAFTKRPEYRQLELNLQNQRIRMEVAKNALLPALDLTARWSQKGLEDSFDESYSQLNRGRYYDWEVGLELSMPLSNRGPKSRYRNARDELRKLGIEKADLENQVVLEVDQAIRKIDHLLRKVQDLDERVRLQRILLAAERRKVEVGMSIAYTVSVIENDLVENLTQALRAMADLQTAKAEYRRATGALLEHHRISVEDPAK